MANELKINGVNHINIRAQGLEQMEKTVDFYHNTLGMELVRRWGNENYSACMVNAGGCMLEIMSTGETGETGVINHFALSVELDQLDQWVEVIRQQGYPITMEPQDRTLSAQPPVPLRIAFFQGPAGEMVELMAERKA